MTIKHAEELTEEVILNMNYPDFVALMQQDNLLLEQSTP